MSKERKHRVKQPVSSSLPQPKSPESTTAELDKLRSQIASLEKTLAYREADIKSLRDHVAWLKSLVWGKKSEKRILGELTPRHEQISMFEIINEGKEDAVVLKPKAEPEKININYSRKRKRAPKVNPIDSLLEFDESVLVEEVILPNPAIEGLTPDQYVVIGEE